MIAVAMRGDLSLEIKLRQVLSCICAHYSAIIANIFRQVCACLLPHGLSRFLYKQCSSYMLLLFTYSAQLSPQHHHHHHEHK